MELTDGFIKIIESKKEKNEFDIVAHELLHIKRSLARTHKKKFEGFNFKNDHIVHGDYLDQNIFFDDSRSVQYVFDWEKVNYEARYHELFRSTFYTFLSRPKPDQTDIDNAKQYLKAYLEVYPMTRDELAIGLEAFCIRMAHYLWIEKEHYLHGNTRPDPLIYSDLYRTKFLCNNYDSIAQQLLS
jgi:Ser/Thr protein kinase RdoA (MazF antagonist)